MASTVSDLRHMFSNPGLVGIDRAELDKLKCWINEERFDNAPISISRDQAGMLFDI